MKQSAGVAVIWKGKTLVVHPTNASWFRTYTSPKGGIESGEKPIDAAIRETFEEIGIRVNASDLKEEPIEIFYKDKKGKTYKKVILFPLIIVKLSDIGMKTDCIDRSHLQQDEVDDARFMTPEEFKDRVLPRYYEPLKELVTKYS